MSQLDERDNRLVIYPGLQHLVSNHEGRLAAEASDLGVMRFPHEIEWSGLVYGNPKALKDNEGETYAVEYHHERLTFTLWND